MEEVIKELKEKAEDYIETLEEIINENKCKDCNGDYKACRFCRLEILDDLKRNISKFSE